MFAVVVVFFFFHNLLRRTHHFLVKTSFQFRMLHICRKIQIYPARYQWFIFSSVYEDANSVNVTPPQDTPMSHRKDGKFINFGIDVEIQKPIEKLPRGTGVGDVDLCKLKLKPI